MKVNMGTIDRGLRILVGLGLIIAAFAGAIGLWGLIGIVPLITGIIGICPAYLPFGFNTCGIKRNES